MATSLPVLNLHEAKFECTFGRGCDGICCKDGQPPVYPEEAERIEQNMHKFTPHLRPEAQAAIEQKGFLTQRQKLGLPMLRRAGGSCVFFNQGCIFHKVGAEEGETFRYKPAPCALFPLERDKKDRWYVRQKNYKGEAWKLFCLDPEISKLPAAESLTEELKLAERYSLEEQTV